MEQFPVTAIGWVSSSRREPVDDDWGEIESTIQLDAAFEAESLRGLAEFSHVEVVYLFHLVDLVDRHRRPPAARQPVVARGRHLRPARQGPPEPHRHLYLPPALGRRHAGEVQGLDAIDGTPVLDLKPYMRQFGPRGEVRQPRWVDEVMTDYF